MTGTTASESAIFIERSVPDDSEDEFRLVAPLTLSLVAPVGLDPAGADRLVEALNRAAWTGETGALNAELAPMPEAVRRPLLEALAQCPDPLDLVVDGDGTPLKVLRGFSFEDPYELADVMEEVTCAGLQVVARPKVQIDGTYRIEVVPLGGRVEADDAEDLEWAPRPDDVALVEVQYPTEYQLEKALRDPRWSMGAARAYGMWLRPEDGVSAPRFTWVFEYFADRVSTFDASNSLGFVVEESLDDFGAVSPRNRWWLYVSLINICNDLERWLADFDVVTSVVRYDMPAIVRYQSQSWWAAMLRSAKRLREAARLDDFEAMKPRTPAEDALVWLASTEPYIAWARRTAEELGESLLERTLPEDEDWDGAYDELLQTLTGDCDVEIIFADDVPGAENPDHPGNVRLAMGDFRPSAWHRLWERAISDAAEGGLPPLDE